MKDLEAVQLDKPLGQVKRVYVGAGVAFIPHPHIRGAWVKVAPCVVRNRCSTCGVGPGELCIFARGRSVGHHYHREDKYADREEKNSARSLARPPT